MSDVVLAKTIAPPWTEMSPKLLGEVPSTLGTPDLYGLVSTAGEPLLRFDLYRGSREYHCFQEAAIWNGFVVVGFAERLHLVGIQSSRQLEFKLGSYFGSFWLKEEFLLAASAEHIFCIGSDGALRWRSPQLGIDGVVMHEVVNQLLHGSGEWDPPGGWKDFFLSLEDGAHCCQPPNPSVKGTATSGLRPLASAPYVER